MRGLLAFLMLATTGFAAPNYKLVWSDEFDKPGLPDPANWSYDIGGWGWGNGELQFYKGANPRNSWVDSGVLKITVRREDTTWGSTGATTTNHLSSARLYTAFKHDWTYGRFEARMKLPKGAGMWPAFWLVPGRSIYGSWPSSGEIDILENYGAEPSVMHGSVHTKNNYGANNRTGYALASHPSDSFHVYGMDWRPDTISILLDGQEYFRYVNPKTTFADWPFDQPFPIVLNVAVSGGWGTAAVDTTALPQSLVVDYVRVYQVSSVVDDSVRISLAQTTGGTISVSPSKPAYARGEKVRIQAIADNGYTFAGWASGTTSTLATDSVLVESLSTLSARFVATGELIGNGGFDPGWEGWSTHYDVATPFEQTLENGMGCVSTHAIGANAWDAQLVYSGLDILPNRDYALSFVARSSFKRTFSMFLSQAGSPWGPLGVRNEVQVDPVRSRQTQTLTTTLGANPARLEVDFANDTGEICLDSISLKLLPFSSAISAPTRNGLRASLRGGILVLASDLAGSWSLRRLDGSLVDQGRLLAGGTRNLRVGAKGLLILRFQGTDGKPFESALTSL